MDIGKAHVFLLVPSSLTVCVLARTSSSFFDASLLDKCTGVVRLRMRRPLSLSWPLRRTKLRRVFGMSLLRGVGRASLFPFLCLFVATNVVDIPSGTFASN